VYINTSSLASLIQDINPYEMRIVIKNQTMKQIIDTHFGVRIRALVTLPTKKFLSTIY
jgi:hypothetical protein